MNEASADTAPSPAPATPSTAGARTCNVDSSEFKLGPHQAFEYKYRTETGASMVYAWKTTTRVKYEFQASPTITRSASRPTPSSKGDYATGALTAGFAGIDVWYWDNPGARDFVCAACLTLS